MKKIDHLPENEDSVSFLQNVYKKELHSIFFTYTRWESHPN